MRASGIAAGLRTLLDAWVLSLAVFALLGLGQAALLGRPDWNALWIEGAGLPAGSVTAIVLAFGLGVVSRAAWARFPTLLVALLCLGDAAGVLAAERLGGFRMGAALPESCALAILLGLWAVCGPAPWPRSLPRRVVRVGLVGATALVAVLAHVLWIGGTRYDATRGDAVLVLGARVHTDGRPSGALEDRTLEACRAWTAGPAGRPIVLSGGHDAGASVSEPEAMARLCRDQGVPDEVLVLDDEGATSADTVTFIRRLARERGWTSVLVVSHDYHLARLQWALRSAGLRAYVVPCRETHTWPGKPLAVAREVAAFLAYLLG